VCVCVLYSNNYMLNMFSMGLMLICVNVTSMVMAMAETFRSSFLFFSCTSYVNVFHNFILGNVKT